MLDKQTCSCCGRPYDTEWVVYCPVTRDLAEQLRAPDGLTSANPVTMKLGPFDEICVTEHYPEHSDGDDWPGDQPTLPCGHPGLPTDNYCGYCGRPLHIDGEVSQ